MKKEKLGFFKKLILVITDFRTYPFLVKHEKFYKSFLYLVKLTLILTLVLTLNVISNFSNVFQVIIENYNEDIPEFELVDNRLNVTEKYNKKINNETYLVINTDYTYEEYIKTKEYSTLVIYDTKTLVNSDKIVIETKNQTPYGIAFKDFDYETNKQSLYEELLKLSNDESYKIYLVVTAFVVIMLGYFVAVFLNIIFLSLIISIICALTGVRLNFGNYMKVAIYSYTLPLILEVVAICLVGPGKDYTYYATLMLTYVYMIYAIRAIRLDAFIMLFSRKNSKPSSSKFEEELQNYNEQVGNDELIESFNKKINSNNEKKEESNNENDSEKKK